MMIFPEKPKRKVRPKHKTLLRFVLVALIIIPMTLFALRPANGQNLFGDAIALSVMICAAVYLVYQAIVFLIAAYLGIPDEQNPPQNNPQYND